MTIINCLKMLIQTVLGACITICIFLPVMLPIFTIFYTISKLAQLLLKIKYKSKATIANGTDVLFSTVGPKSYAVVNVAHRINGQMNVAKYKSRLLKVLHNSVNQKGQKRYKRLTQTYCKEYGYALWMDYEAFDVDQHISVINKKDLLKKSLENETNLQNGPVNSTHVEKLKQFSECNKDIDFTTLMKIVLNEFGAKKMNPELPQWQVLFIEESKERYTLIFRFHHAIADGVYMSRFVCEVFQDEPTDLAHGYIPPSSLKSLLLGLWSFCLIPFGLWKMVKNNDKNVLLGVELSGKKRFYLSDLVELESLRNIRKRTHLGTSNILFSCLSNAVASHFERRSTTVKGITVLFPVPRQNLQKEIKFKNKFAIHTMKIPTPPKMNTTFKNSLIKGCSSLERLQMIKSSFEGAKSDPSFMAGQSIITTACSIFPIWISELLLTPFGITINFSNLSGLKTGVHFGDDSIEEIVFWNPDHDPLGNGVSILSYNGKFRIGLFIDEALLEDETEGDQFLQDFMDEVKNISQELDNQQSTAGDIKLEYSKFLMQYS